MAAVLATSWPEIDQLIGAAHDLAVVFDHEDRVAKVAQLVQDLDQPSRVAAVQAD